jgi:hypothetical protein
MATRLRKLQINEVSLCDSGANPGAMITLFKRHIPDDEIEVHADNDRHFRATGRGPAHDKLQVAYDNRRRATAYGQRAFELAWAEDLTDDDRDQIRNEEAATVAAKAALAAAETERAKEEMAKSDTEILIKGARAISRGDFLNDIISATRWHQELRKYAGARQLPAESIQMSVVRLVQTDPDAKALFRAALGGMVDDAPAPAAAPVVKTNTANDAIRSLADDLQKADPNLSRLDALVKIHHSHPSLAAAAKAA